MDERAQPIAVLAPGQGRDADGPHTGTDETRLDVATGLIQLSRLVQDVHARLSQRHDLASVQAKLLCVLAGGPKGMTELAHCFGVEKAALTGLVDRAERRGLVTRSPVPGDRRALRVTLTDTGRRAAAAFHAEATAELGHLVSPLPPDDREHFRTAIAKIIAGAQRTIPRDQPSRPAGSLGSGREHRRDAMVEHDAGD
jgi:DNA-binding MarR family transcriptional regulator